MHIGPSLAHFSRHCATAVLDIEANGYEGSTVPSEIGLLPALENFYIRASDVGGTIDYMANMQSICKYNSLFRKDFPKLVSCSQHHLSSQFKRLLI